MKFGVMKSHRRNRLLLVCFVVLSAAGATTFALMALNENINLFYPPADIVAGVAPVGQSIRAGGMVMAGSVQRSETDLSVRFVISDMKEAQVTVEYDGILPDLFREGQGIIARGQLNQAGVFVAEEVLAKHDENYMPPEIAEVMAEAHSSANRSLTSPSSESPSPVNPSLTNPSPAKQASASHSYYGKEAPEG